MLFQQCMSERLAPDVRCKLLTDLDFPVVSVVDVVVEEGSATYGREGLSRVMACLDGGWSAALTRWSARREDGVVAAVKEALDVREGAVR